jgi:MtN3 and saliva related transmembrane protein
MMSTAEFARVIGFVAGALTTVSFVPQVVRSWTRRSCADLSLGMLVAFTIGVALWTAYGVLTRALPIILTNAVTLLLALALIGMKRRFR